MKGRNYFSKIVGCIFYLSLSACLPVYAQQQLNNTFNYNINNGLPSDHVYGLLRDRLGYLWVATSKGVGRFNGYDFRIFNQSDGISNEDIWELCEDKKGRIWLSNISNEYGYIYNNRHGKASVDSSSYTIYPRDARRLGEKVIFFSSIIGGDRKMYLCEVSNDTIYKYEVGTLLPTRSKGSEGRFYTGIIDEAGKCYLIQDTSKVYQLVKNGNRYVAKLVLQFDDEVGRNFANNFNGIVNDRIISYPTVIKDNTFHVINIVTKKSQRVDLKKMRINEKINYVYIDINGGKGVFVITRSGIHKFECSADTLKYTGSIDVKELLVRKDVDAGKIGSFHTDILWGNCLGSTTNGLFLNYSIANKFRKEADIDIQNFRYVGGISGAISFWWSEMKNTLAVVEKNGKVNYSRIEKIRRVNSVIHYRADSFILSSVGSYYYILKSKSIVPISNIKNISIIKPVFAANSSIRNFYAITNLGFCKMHENADAPIFLDVDRYRDLVYDSIKRNYWAYNFDRIFIHGQNGDAIIGKQGLSNLGIEKVEKIEVERRYGNFFFKGSNNITIYDPQTNKYKDLFKNINLKESSLLLYNDLLVVVGNFGVLFSKIYGKNQMSQPLFYPNIKNRNYKFIYGCAILGDWLLLNTDQGAYSVQVPNDCEKINASSDSILFNYKFVLYNGDTVRNFVTGDTIIVKQIDKRLQFDVINPYGNGVVKYRYKLQGDSLWYSLNANELTLSGSMEPDNYYDIKLIAHDDVWKSDTTILHLYVEPYWYQTKTSRRVIGISVFTGVLLILIIIILITRKIVLRAAQRRNFRMELELKALYAQLNPHFVFNTLNSALYLIKKEKLEDASLHISKFARLLRSYLDSSRNRYIALSEEISNIKNYIEIQQTRFGNIFTYDIVISSNVTHPERVFIPSLLLQPIIENAINHGLIPKEENGHLKIEINATNTENEIICVIDDNGIGRKKSRMLYEDSTLKKESHGTNLINELIAIINKYEKLKIEIKYIDKEEPLTGTIVELIIRNYQHGKV